jgi:uncharacterized membrane protein
MTETTSALPAALRRSRLVVLASCYGLLLYFLISSTIAINRFGFTTVLIWLIQVIPVLIFLPGLHRQRVRSYAWMTFVILLYFMHAVLAAFDPGRRIFGFVEIGLCAVMFLFLILYIRQYRAHFGVPI